MSPVRLFILKFTKIVDALYIGICEFFTEKEKNDERKLRSSHEIDSCPFRHFNEKMFMNRDFL